LSADLGTSSKESILRRVMTTYSIEDDRSGASFLAKLRAPRVSQFLEASLKQTRTVLILCKALKLSLKRVVR